MISLYNQLPKVLIGGNIFYNIVYDAKEYRIVVANRWRSMGLCKIVVFTYTLNESDS